jgi:dolichol-phosphate mannosyltransferase
MKKILIATATYNEAGNIKILLKKIINLKIKLDILIIDDNSPDETYLQVKKFMERFNNIFLINRNKKKGLDTAHKYIYNFALKKNYDYLITMDADLSHDPNIIPKFIKQIKNYDFVIGSRYMKGGRNDLKGFRLLLSKFGNLFIRFILNINLTEFTTSYRCFNLKTLKKFNLKKINAGGYSFFMETLYQIKKMGYSIKEIPIIFYERNHGKSKIPKIELLRTLLNIFLIRFKF